MAVYGIGHGLARIKQFVYKWHAVLSRRERALAKLSGIDPQNTFIRRSIARTVFYLVIWCGFVSGIVAVLTVGILLMGGPTLLAEVWDQKESGGPYQHRLFAFGIFAMIAGGWIGVLYAWKFAVHLIRMTGLLSEEVVEKVTKLT